MKLLFTTVASCASLAAISGVSATKYFEENFTDENCLQDRWVESRWKYPYNGKIERSAGEWFSHDERDQGLTLTEDHRYYTIGSKLEKPFSNKGEDLVLQYSAKHAEKGIDFCGGGYIKLLSSDVVLEKWTDDSPYHIMFGPDLCGRDISRIHVIFNHKGENLHRKEDIGLEGTEKDNHSHLFTLVVRPDKTYTVYLDMKEKASGSLWEDWDFPSKMINDPSDTKPEDWVNVKMIVDAEDVKPEGYDDIKQEIVDPTGEKPEDWDEEDDGEWEPPTILNPEYKGEWKPTMIDNPEYKGEWKAKQIDNPSYDENIVEFNDIGAVGFELWTVNSGSTFDNIYIGNSLEEANAIAEETFKLTRAGEIEPKKEYDDKKKLELETTLYRKKAVEDHMDLNHFHHETHMKVEL